MVLLRREVFFINLGLVYDITNTLLIYKKVKFYIVHVLFNYNPCKKNYRILTIDIYVIVRQRIER